MTYLDTAGSIAQTICDRAEWNGDRCVWQGDHRTTVGDVDLYAGTAGVAWFLARLADVTGDSYAARTAIGAARHTLDRLEDPTRKPLAGLQGGDMGALWSVTVVADRLQRPELAKRAEGLQLSLHRRLSRAPRPDYDILGGLAGDAIAAVRLERVWDGPFQTDLDRLGDRLIDGAAPGAIGLQWPSSAEESGPSIGLAHGVAGVTWALLELYACTGSDRYLRAALQGLAFERSWFDRMWCGWRDPVTGRITSNSWCHGTVGIGLVLLRALELAPQPQLKAEAGAAIARVHSAVARLLASNGSQTVEESNFSVCHGLMGLADLLLYASNVLGVAEHRRAAERVAARGRALALATGTWACGTIDSSESVGLMLGLAGIGAVMLSVASDEPCPPVGLPC